MRIFTTALVAMWLGTSWAQTRSTFPIPPRPKKADPALVTEPSTQVPKLPEKYRFLATTKFDGKDLGSAKITVFGFSKDDQNKFDLGEIAPGSEITMEFFQFNNGTYYYAVPFANIQTTKTFKGNQPKWAWISGRNIEVVAK